MFKNAFCYVTRKILKSLVILLIVVAMSTLSLVGMSIKTATDHAKKETFKNISNSFSMQINRRVNQGTPRGGGNLKGQDIDKITKVDGIKEHIKRMGVVADLIDHDIIETSQTKSNQSAERAKNFVRTVMVTGVNNSAKEDKFVSEAYKLTSGRHLNDKDKNAVLMHEDLAKKNNLKIGDKLKIKSNLYDADNEKQADETVEVTIVGLFSGKNKTGVTYAQEFYENTLVSDLHTTAKLYGETEKTAIYQDATFFVDGNKNLDSVMNDVKKLGVNWKAYQLVKSSSNYPSLQKSISGVYGTAGGLMYGSLFFSGIVLSLILFLWINARRKEIGILLAIGKSKAQIFGQFVIELVLISTVGFAGSYVVAENVGKNMANGIVNQTASKIAKNIEKESKKSKVSGGAEVDGFNKTLTSLDININPSDLVFVVIFGNAVLLGALLIASARLLNKQPKELLSDIE